MKGKKPEISFNRRYATIIVLTAATRPWKAGLNSLRRYASAISKCLRLSRQSQLQVSLFATLRQYTTIAQLAFGDVWVMIIYT